MASARRRPRIRPAACPRTPTAAAAPARPSGLAASATARRRAILARHRRMAGGLPLAELLHRRAACRRTPARRSRPSSPPRPTAAAPGPPPLQRHGRRRRHGSGPRAEAGAGHRRGRPPCPRPPAGPRPSRRRAGPSRAAAGAAPPRRTRPCHRPRCTEPAGRQRPGRGQPMTGRRNTAALVTQAPHARARRPRPQAQRAAARLGARTGERRPAWLTAQRRAPPTGARPAVTAAAPHQPVRAAGIPASTARVLPVVAPLATRQASTRRRARAAQHAAYRPPVRRGRPVVRAGEGGDRASAALPTKGTLPASGAAGRPSTPGRYANRASGSGAPAFTLPKLLEHALLPSAHARRRTGRPARLASAVARASPRSNPAAPPATPDTGGAGQAQPAGRGRSGTAASPGGPGPLRHPLTWTGSSAPCSAGSCTSWPSNESAGGWGDERQQGQGRARTCLAWAAARRAAEADHLLRAVRHGGAGQRSPALFNPGEISLTKSAYLGAAALGQPGRSELGVG